MAVSLKHSFVSAKLDDPDATFVRPSNWNAEHALTLATAKLLGRATAGAGAAEEITLGTNLSFSGTTLNAAAATDGDKGDITVAGSGATWTIDPGAVTYAKLQAVSAASRLLGRGSAGGAGDAQEITLGAGLAMTGTTLAATAAAATVTPPQGRLTLQTATPVMTTTQSAKTTIFYSPYVGASIGLYDGSAVVMMTFAELSALTTDTTKSPAAIGASKVNDWFVWNDGGTVRLGHGPDWTNDTTRSAGTALVMVNGLLLNSVSITNGPAASRGTYVGTTRSDASSQLNWTLPTIATNWGAGDLAVWNMYNRVQVNVFGGDTTANWTYAVANTWRAANGKATARISFVRGLNEDGICAQYQVVGSSSASGEVWTIAVGLNTTTGVSGTHSFSNVAQVNFGAFANYSGLGGLGYNFVSANEFTVATGATTFYGQSSYNQIGLHLQGRF